MPPNQSQSLSMETVVLKVNVDCHGCRRKVKKILKKIEGVYAVNIDAEQQRAVVIGVADSATLIKKLAKSGKRAELWSPKSQQLDLNQETISLGKTKNKTPMHYLNNSRRAVALDQLVYPNLHGGGSFGSEWGLEGHVDRDMELEEAEELANLYMGQTGHMSNRDGNYEHDIDSMISMMSISGNHGGHDRHRYHNHRRGYDMGSSNDSGRFQRFQNYRAGTEGYGYHQQPSPLMVENLLGPHYNQNPYVGWLNSQSVQDGYAHTYHQY